MENSTRAVLDLFEQISAVPRNSRQEGRIRQWLQQWAAAHNLQCILDPTGNLLIRVAASQGYESAAAVVIQSHVDMVCEKLPNSAHDFTRDPLRLSYEGDWLTAQETTLGADNGIGMALALRIAEDNQIAHPPLELLFTYDEETGLVGAGKLPADFLTGRILINLDSDNEGVFTIGCAGGRNSNITLPLQRESATFVARHAGEQWVELTLGGFPGGHSGVDIHRQRGNAIRSLARLLTTAPRGGRIGSDIAMSGISGGTAHNAIPRDAIAQLCGSPNALALLQRHCAQLVEALRREYSHTAAEITLSFDPVDAPAVAPLRPSSVRALLRLLLALPDGVARMWMALEGSVETSNTIAQLACHSDKATILVSLRSSFVSTLDELENRIVAATQLAGGETHSSLAYSAWEPDFESPLAQRCREVYRRLFAVEPTVEVTHAGVEAGVISAKYAGMQAISCGPTLRHLHSPSEKLLIPSVGRIYRFLTSLLAELK